MSHSYKAVKTIIEYDTSQTGLRAVLKGYQEIALRVIWESSGPLGSKVVMDQVNKRLEDSTISRASIINFLEDMREMGILNGEERTGKGGHHWVYSPSMNEYQFKQFIASTILANMVRDFPRETIEALKKIS